MSKYIKPEIKEKDFNDLQNMGIPKPTEISNYSGPFIGAFPALSLILLSRYALNTPELMRWLFILAGEKDL